MEELNSSFLMGADHFDTGQSSPKSLLISQLGNNWIGIIEISLPDDLVHSDNLAVYGIALVPTNAYDLYAEPGETVMSTKAMPSKELDGRGTYLEVVYIHRD